MSDWTLSEFNVTEFNRNVSFFYEENRSAKELTSHFLDLDFPEGLIEFTGINLNTADHTQ